MSVKPFADFDSEYTQVHNAVFDSIMRLAKPNTFKVVMAIYRKTRGWQKKSDCLSFSQIMDITGIGGRETTNKAIQDALEQSFITRDPSGTTFRYRLNEQYEIRTSSKTELSASSETEPLPVLKQNTQKKEETIKDTIESAEKPGKVSKPELTAMVYALQEVTKMDASINWGMLAKSAKKIVLAGYTPEQVRQVFCDGGAWYDKDWRGQKGQPPKPTDIEQNLSVLLAVETKVLTNTTGGLYG